MAKESGLALDGLGVDDAAGVLQDIRADVTNFDFATPRATQDVTGVDKVAFERLLLLADFQLNLSGVFDDAANSAFQVFKTVPSTDVVRTTTITMSAQIMSNECLYTSFDWTRANTGALTYTANGVLADGTAPTWTT